MEVAGLGVEPVFLEEEGAVAGDGEVDGEVEVGFGGADGAFGGDFDEAFVAAEGVFVASDDGGLGGGVVGSGGAELGLGEDLPHGVVEGGGGGGAVVEGGGVGVVIEEDLLEGWESGAGGSRGGERA